MYTPFRSRRSPFAVTAAARLLLWLLTATSKTTKAYKDDSYYMAGSGNPNVNQRMYWKDAENVLQDLSKFKALYVEFSHCAWTWMQMEEADNDVEENGKNEKEAH